MAGLKFKGRRVLLTGASSGLGREMAWQLALREKADLILVARRRERLEELASDIRKKAGVTVQVIAADLCVEADVERIYQEATEAGEVYAAVLNAGVTYFGEHKDLSWAAYKNLLETNVNSLVRLSSLFSRSMQDQADKGGLLLISSMAGYAPVPYQSAYSGTKAFVSGFGRALAYELRASGVSVTVFAPGGIATEMVEISGLGHYFKSQWTLMSVERCAHLGLTAFTKRKTFYVPGFLNRCAIALMKVIGSDLTIRAVGGTFQKALAVLPAPAPAPAASER